MGIKEDEEINSCTIRTKVFLVGIIFEWCLFPLVFEDTALMVAIGNKEMFE
jgi:hypothetical protein